MSAFRDAFAAARSEFRGRTLWVVLGCLICQMGLGLTYVSRGLSVEIIEALELTRTQFAGASTPQLTMQSLASPLVGYLTIRFGASRVLATSAVLFAGVFFFFSQVESMLGFYVAIAGVGLCAAGMGDISVGHAVTQWVHKNRGLALGIAYAGSNLGGTMMVGLTGAVAGAYSWREGLLAVVPIALFVLLPATLFLIKDRTGAQVAASEEQARERGEAPEEERSLSLAEALRTRSFWILTATLFTFFFYFTGVLDHLVLFLTDQGVSKQDAREWLGLAISLGILSKVLGGFLADRIPHEKAILYDFALLAISSFLLMMLPNPTLLPIFILTYGFAQAARDVVYPLVIERCFGRAHLASIYGAMTVTLLPGAALGPLFSAVLRDHYGNYDAAFATYAFLNTAAAAGLLLVRDERVGPGAPQAETTA
ncbi:MAG: MFS transporter [Myxococcota bacterium]